jgi:6-phosphogluconolactonase
MIMEAQNRIQIFQTSKELAIAAGWFIIEVAKSAVEARGRFVISLSGGHTPEQLYTLLSKPPFSDQIPWNKTFVFWGDERCVPIDDNDNNAHIARIQLLHIVIPADHIYPIPVNLQSAIAASEYESTIKNFFKEEPPRFDLILLGLGINGHTASLFPWNDVVPDNTRLVKEVYVVEQKMFRITMTAPLINHAYNIIFLVSGDDKAEILNTVLTTSYQPDKYPAQLIKPVNGNLYWYVDSHAAALLPYDIRL